MKTNNTFLFVLLALLIGATAACSGGSVADTPAPPTDIPVSIDNTPPVTPTTEATLPAAVEATEPALAVELWPSDRFGYGIQSHAIIGDPAQAMMVVADQLRLDWVKVQLEWPLVEPIQGEYQWHYYDGVVEQAEAHGLRLLFSVVGAPQWSRTSAGENGPPDDFQLYSGFLADLMGRYEGQIGAVEVWNEQNLGREWTTGQSLSPGAYVALLSTAYQTVKSIDPNVIIISGALAPTGVTDWVTSVDDFEYLGQALDAGLLQYVDCVGVHHNGYNIGPTVPFDLAANEAEAATAIFRGPFDNPHHSWSFKTTVDTYADMVQALDPSMRLCVTEFGWASSEGYEIAPQHFEFALDNTLEEQAGFIVEAYQQMYASGNVWLAFLFNFDFGNKGNGPADDPVPYSIIDTIGAPRPAFDAVAAMEKLP